jgi:hypothetical protein
MGLTTAITQVEDLCGIIFGCRLPCILRNANQEQSYKFIGATYLVGKQAYESEGGGIVFPCLGHDDSKDWVDWDVEKQDIYLV